MIPFEYCSCKTVDEALSKLFEKESYIIAGGTDLLPSIRKNKIRPKTLIDVSALDSLRYIESDTSTIKFGALTTFLEINNSPELRLHANALLQAAKTIGSMMITARATLGGNLANASPAADSVPALLVHNATVTVRSKARKRKISVNELLQGPGTTTLSPDEMIVEIEIPREQELSSVYLKLGRRKGMAVAVASVAVALGFDADHRINDSRVAFGSVAPRCIRCAEIEDLLLNKKYDEIPWSNIMEMINKLTDPIDDLRASAEYRKRVSQILLRRAIKNCFINVEE